jgi:hypothetical protein
MHKNHPDTLTSISDAKTAAVTATHHQLRSNRADKSP